MLAAWPHPRPQVVVTEGAPTYQGQRMAAELAGAGIHATLVADAAVFAMMARVNKVGPGWLGWAATCWLGSRAARRRGG